MGINENKIKVVTNGRNLNNIRFHLLKVLSTLKEKYKLDRDKRYLS